MTTSTQPAADTGMSLDHAREEFAYALGLVGYIWGFPLQTYNRLIPEALRAGGTEVNTLRKLSRLRTAENRLLVMPSNVTLEAYAVLDLNREPIVLHVPALATERWYLVQINDMFDEVAYNVGGIGGPRPGDYVIVGPEHDGPLPAEMHGVRLRTYRGVIAAHICVQGDADLAAAVDAQRGFRVMPLSDYQREGLGFQTRRSAAPITPYVSEADIGLRAFDELGHAIQTNLPASADTGNAMMKALHQIGLSVGRGFEWHTLNEATVRGLKRAQATAEQLIDQRWAALGETTNGWRYNMSGGRSGHDFVLRAALAKFAIGSQVASELLYSTTTVDERGEPLEGSHAYVLRFEHGQSPPVAAFWNLALYCDDLRFFENEMGRYSIGSTTDGLIVAADGSLSIRIQSAPPEEKANWLPAPKGPFSLTMRLYGPLTPVLEGSYRLPAVQRV